MDTTHYHGSVWDHLVKKGRAEEGRNTPEVTFNSNSLNTKANDFLTDTYEHCGRLSVVPRKVTKEASVFWCNPCKSCGSESALWPLKTSLLILHERVQREALGLDFMTCRFHTTSSSVSSYFPTVYTPHFPHSMYDVSSSGLHFYPGIVFIAFHSVFFSVVL